MRKAILMCGMCCLIVAFSRMCIASDQCNFSSLVITDCSSVTKGMRIALNTIISVPKSNGIAKVTLEFSRSAVNRNFLTKFFLRPDEELRMKHPFAQRGIETSLTAKRLSVTVHEGVTLHLRNDIPLNRSFKTFTGNIRGEVVEVVGTAYVSNTPQRVRKRFDDVFVLFHGPTTADQGTRLEDGSLLFVAPLDRNDLPDFYEPVIK